MSTQDHLSISPSNDSGAASNPLRDEWPAKQESFKRESFNKDELSAALVEIIKLQDHSGPVPQTMQVPEAEEKVTEFLAEDRFHRSIEVDPDTDTDRQWKRSSPLRVVYSDLGHPEGHPVLFCGGLFGSRYTLALADQLAKDRNIRLITPDKPGIGGTDAVDIDQKVDAWLDIVEALVERLDLGHVTLVGHSSGTIYVLNTILRLRRVLDPRRPFVVLIAPWVHPADSHAFQATVASALPDWAIHRWYEATHFLSRTGIAPKLGPSTARPGVEMKNTDLVTKAMDEKVLEYALAENVEGVSQEALFCLRRGPKEIWGPWEDYEGYLSLLKESEGKHGERPTLEMDVFFAESDNSSGNRGSEKFDELWKSRAKDFIDYRSTKAPGTTHETIMRPEHGVLDAIFQKAIGK